MEKSENDLEDGGKSQPLGRFSRMSPALRRFYTLLGLGLLCIIGLYRVLHTTQRPCIDKSTQAVLLRTYRRHLEEMQGAMQQFRTDRSKDHPQTAALEVQLDALQRQLYLAQTQLAQQQQQQPQQMQFAQPQLQNGAEAVPRMSPTLERIPLPSDVKDWSKQPKIAPSFQQLYNQLYAKEWDVKDNVIMTFPNPYKKVAHMNYPHSSVWLEGSKIMERVVQELAPNKIKFIVEAGSMHGGSAIKMAMELDKRGLKEVPILCIDPWTGDLNMWLNRIVWEHLDVRDGRATTYDQFVLNVRKAITDGSISPHHINPFPVSSVIGARWLQATGFTPNLIYLDSAHEIDETYYELCLYWNLLEPGGILMGDDYGWLSVKMDVDRFLKDKGLQITMFGVYYNWFVKKPAVP